MFTKFFFVFCLACVVLVNALTDQKQFEEFKKKYSKKYSPEEEQTRFKNFQAALRHIEEANAKYDRGEASHFEGINEFADLSSDEWAQRHGLRSQP